MINIIKFCAIIFALISVFNSCSKDGGIEPQPNPLFEYSESPFDLQGIGAKFVKNIAYDTKARTQFDIWLPESSTPTGLVIYVHGGGFQSSGPGKDYVYYAQKGGQWDFPTDIRSFLNQRVAFITMQYTVLEPFPTEEEGVKKPMNDVRRALQYIRSRAEDFNIDKEKVVLAGNSAGAGTSLWIAFNDDMADIGNADPVLQESTRVKGVAVRETQASYDVEDRWINDVFVDYSIEWNDFSDDIKERFLQFYGVNSISEYNTSEIDTYRDDVDMLTLFTADDPPIWVDNTLRDVVEPTTDVIANHHAFHARELKEKADLIGIENVSYYGKDPILFSDPSGETWVEFCVRKLNE